MNEHSPLLKVNQQRCHRCGGLLNAGGAHLNLTDCGAGREANARLINSTIGWHSIPTGWFANSPKNPLIVGA